jgi:DNA end-binding protein Ku
VLVAQNMIWPDELRAAVFPVLADAKDMVVDPRLLPVARTVISSMIEDWNPGEHRDAYTDALSAAIEAKAAGQVISADTDASGPAPDDVADLIAKLEASQKKKAPAKRAPAKRAPAKAAPSRRRAS